MSILTLEERQRRWEKVRKAMGERGLECLIVWGSMAAWGTMAANLRYLSDVITEGYLVFPVEGEPTLFTFQGHYDPKSWVADSRTGMPMYSKAISERLRELHLENGRIGMVGQSGYFGEMGFSYTTYTSLINNFPGANFEDATDILEEARKIKSAAEIRCFELACEVADKVIQAVVDTAKVGVRDYEVRATIMDTLFRNGCEPGSMILYYSGKVCRHAGEGGFSQPPGQRALEPGDVILTEFDAKYLGYMAQYNQPFSVGEPSQEWQEIFNVALESFNNGFKTLRPGITVGELDEAFLSPIKEAGYPYLNPPFHGLGLTGLEMPMGTFPGQPLYKPNTSLKIEAGMVLEFEPHAVAVDGTKGLHIGLPVAVTETGCRLLSKSWKPEFKVV